MASKKITKEEIRKDPDKILKDKDKLKEVINEPENTVELLKAKGIMEMKVGVDGQEIELVRPVMESETIERMKKMRKLVRGV
jgi:hypothetical protein